MAEFYQVLKKAVGGLHPNTTESRRGVYEKARNALVAQLKGINPPLANAEISRRRLEMEEAIRRVERDNAEAMQSNPTATEQPSPDEAVVSGASGGGRDEAAWPPPPGFSSRRDGDWPPAGGGAFQRPPQEVDRRPPPSRQGEYLNEGRSGSRDSFGGDNVPPSRYTENQDTDRRGPQAFEWSSEGRRDFESREPISDRAPPSEPRTRRRGPRIEMDEGRSAPAKAADEQRPRRGRSDGAGRRDAPDSPRLRSRLPGFILLFVFLLLVGGVAVFILRNREVVAAVLKDPKQIVSVMRNIVSPSTTPAKTTPPAATAGKAAPTPTDTASTAAQNRQIRSVGEGGGTPAAGGGAQVAPATAQGAGAPAGAGANDPAGAGANTAPPPVTAPAAVPVVAGPPQKATLVEESTAAPGSKGATLAGSVTWAYVDGGPDGPAVQAKVSIPDRKLDIVLSFHKNSDPTASHQIDINVAIGVGSTMGAIDSIPTMVLRANDQDGGTKIAGRAVKLIEACASPTAAAPKCKDATNKPAAASAGVYWIAMSPIKTDVAANVALLRDKPFIDLPLAYKTGQRAYITIEKGQPGASTFAKAIAAWGN